MQIGFGGGCHWCTEAVFQALRGVCRVQQGFIASQSPHDSFSEAVIVDYDPAIIGLEVLVEIHLRSHASQSQHSMRGKYRSAIYCKNSFKINEVNNVLKTASDLFDRPLVTLVLEMTAFTPSKYSFQNYYKNGPNRPFCKTYIDPKLAMLRREFSAYV